MHAFMLQYYIYMYIEQVRDLISWMHDMIALFTVDEQAKSVSQAESMIAKHNEHKVIIMITSIHTWFSIIMYIHTYICMHKVGMYVRMCVYTCIKKP